MKKTLLSVLALLAFTFGGTAQTLPSYVPANGLVGWWPFNGNANDESGNGNNGTNLGSVGFVNDRNNNSSSALVFPNSDSKIWIPFNLLGELPCANDHSFSFWVKLNSQPKLSGNQQSIAFCNGRLPGESGINAFGNWYYLFPNSVFEGAWYDRSQVHSNDSIPTKTWTLITYVFRASQNQFSVYVNGIDKTDYTYPNVSAGWSGQCTAFSNLGNYYVGNAPYNNARFDGNVDDLGVWNRALTQQEITGLYQGANTTANCPTFPASLAQGLVGYWPFCGNALDESGNNNHGTVNGATLTTDRFGNQGSAYGFDGQSNYIKIQDSINQNDSAITISAWFKPEAVPGSFSSIVSTLVYNPSNPFKGIELHLWSNMKPGIQLGNTNSWIPLGGSINSGFDPVLLSNWYFGTIKLKNNILELFINGIKSDSTNISNYFPNINTPIIFGGRGQFPQSQITDLFTGSLDDIAIWNRALTQQEIQQVYNQGICQTSITVTDTLLIHTGITSYNPVAYGNTLKVWPNPGNTAITLDAGNLALMQGWKIRISNSLGQEVYPATLINQQQQVLSMSTWGGNGLYLLHLINPQGHITEVKKIVLAP